MAAVVRTTVETTMEKVIDRLVPFVPLAPTIAVVPMSLQAWLV